MGNTYRKQSTKFDDDYRNKRNNHKKHSNNRKTGGMKIINDYSDDCNYFDEEVLTSDKISINKIDE